MRLSEGFGQERRKFVRINSDLPVELKELPAYHPINLRNLMSLDISEGGLKLSAFYFYPVNSRLIIQVFLSPKMEPVKAVGKVSWVEQVPYQDRYKIGVEFSDITEEGRYNLRNIIKENSAPKRPSELVTR